MPPGPKQSHSYTGIQLVYCWYPVKTNILVFTGNTLVHKLMSGEAPHLEDVHDDNGRPQANGVSTKSAAHSTRIDVCSPMFSAQRADVSV